MTGPDSRATAPDLDATGAPDWERLRRAARAGAGLVYLVTWEDERTHQLVEAVARTAFDAPLPCHVWSVTEGLVRAGQALEGTRDLATALLVAARAPEDAVYLFRDVPAHLADPVVRRALRDCFRTSRQGRRAVFLTGTRLELPEDLAREVLVLDLALPGPGELAAIVDGLTAAHPAGGAPLPADRHEAYVNALRGLTIEEAELALRDALLDHPPDSDAAVAATVAFKRQVTRKLGVLTFVDEPVREADVGGLETLKQWLRVHRAGLGTEARRRRLRPPKGMLVMGVPGCGKSLSVQLVAGMWALPLLRLDLASVYSGAFGTPEESLHRALGVAEAVAPCVLWIDEIEKGVAGIRSAETGVAARVFGTFLTWMQEKTSPVFVAATANMIDLLPPEVLRKGRFDEIFFIDLPGAREREAIWTVHLRRLGIEAVKYPPPELAKMTANFNGAEIEQVAVNATLLALAERRAPGDHDLLLALGRTVPLSKTMAEKIGEIRRWARDRAVPASPPD